MRKRTQVRYQTISFIAEIVMWCQRGIQRSWYVFSATFKRASSWNPFDFSKRNIVNKVEKCLLLGALLWEGHFMINAILARTSPWFWKEGIFEPKDIIYQKGLVMIDGIYWIFRLPHRCNIHEELSISAEVRKNTQT